MSNTIGRSPFNPTVRRDSVPGHANNNFDQLKTSLNRAINNEDHKAIKQCLTDILSTDKINESLTRNGDTALIVAAGKGHTDIVELLVGAGADVNKADKIGLTALMYAVQDGHADIMKLLFKARADVNQADSGGLTALMLAAEVGDMDIVRLLLEAGADVNKADNDGLTALMLAAKHGHTDIVNVLLGKVENVEEAIGSLVGYKKVLIFN